MTAWAWEPQLDNRKAEATVQDQLYKLMLLMRVWLWNRSYEHSILRNGKSCKRKCIVPDA